MNEPKAASPLVLQYGAQRPRSRRIAVGLAIALAAYVGIYVGARGTGMLVHYENVVIAERNGWWYGHEIGPGAVRVPTVMLLPLRPLMLAEELIRGTVWRLTR